MCLRVLENNPVGLKILERHDCVLDSEIKAEKEQPDHEILTTIVTKLTMLGG